MADIYAQHRAAFAKVEAFVILDGADTSRRAATVALKFPADGAGRVYAYVQWFGADMVRAYAGGYGYDKRSRAVSDAVRKLPDTITARQCEADPRRNAFIDALGLDNGHDWTRNLEAAGFTVLQAV